MFILDAVINMAVVTIMARGRGIMKQHSYRRSPRESALERAVVHMFRRAGWQVVLRPRIAKICPDLLVRRGDRQYAVEIKSSPEARPDRLIPLLSQAILQARAAASKADISPNPLPLAIIGAPRLSQSLIENLRSFGSQVAPDVAIGIIDLEGSRVFVGHGLESLSSSAPRRSQFVSLPHVAPRLHLFSDLNEWMLKVLLSPRIPEHLLQAPRQQLESVSDLARAARVSPMSAFRCVSLLKAGGFLHEHSPVLRLVNVEVLLQRWRAASLRPVQELSMRWIIPGDPKRQLSDAVRAYLKKWESAVSRDRRASRALQHPRICLGLFAAADVLGFGVVRGVAPHLYLERLDPLALESLGLAPARPGQRADVFVRVPSFRESVFRAAVVQNGIPVCDIIQVWLDVADHPSRGASQAKEIWRQVLVSLWRERQNEPGR